MAICKKNCYLLTNSIQCHTATKDSIRSPPSGHTVTSRGKTLVSVEPKKIQQTKDGLTGLADVIESRAYQEASPKCQPIGQDSVLIWHLGKK